MEKHVRQRSCGTHAGEQPTYQQRHHAYSGCVHALPALSRLHLVANHAVNEVHELRVAVQFPAQVGEELEASFELGVGGDICDEPVSGAWCVVKTGMACSLVIDTQCTGEETAMSREVQVGLVDDQLALLVPDISILSSEQLEVRISMQYPRRDPSEICELTAHVLGQLSLALYEWAERLYLANNQN